MPDECQRCKIVRRLITTKVQKCINGFKNHSWKFYPSWDEHWKENLKNEGKNND